MSGFHDNVLLGASGSQGYQISRSVRLRSSASASFSRTPGSATNQKTWTWSAWVKRGSIADGGIFSAGTSGTSYFNIRFQPDNISIVSETPSLVIELRTTPVYRDPSSWYHIVFALDTTQATSTNRAKLYVNGVQVTAFSSATYPSLNLDMLVNSAVIHYNGRAANGAINFDGYLTEVNFIDGQALTPASFGETNPVTGVWQPKKYTGTYGTNGFYLNFSDNSAATAAAIGKDYSGNGNNWTPNNISVTAGATYDSMLDVPTLWADGGNGRGNYCVVNPLDKGSLVTISDGNLRITGNSASNSAVARSGMGVSTGKWYWETTITTVGGISYAGMGIEPAQDNAEQYWISSGYTKGCGRRNGGGALYTGYGGYGAVSGITATSFTTGDVIGVAVDFDNGALYYSKNGTFENSGVPTSGSSKTGAFNVWTAGAITGFPAGGGYNGSVNDLNMGQRPFAYTPPTGFKALNTGNLPTPTISNGASYMAATTYTGTGASLTIANTVGSASFQPDLVWVKGRSGATDHAWYDAVRGVQKQLESNSTGAETTETTGLTAFGSTGFTVGALAQMNTNTATYVAWQWNAGGSTVTNTSGSISAQVRANPTAGFSVVTYTGTGSTGTVGHGLGIAPSMIISKNRSAAENWRVAHIGLTNMASWHCNLDTTQAQSNSGAAIWNNTTPTSTIFGVGTDTSVSGNGNLIVAYCFAAVAGYSAFGSYLGNGSADGTFVFTGFRPRYVMIKGSSFVSNWFVIDTSRSPVNVSLDALRPNLDGAEVNSPTTTYSIDILSNGFKLRTSAADSNTNGATFIYACFAENPFKNALAR